MRNLLLSLVLVGCNNNNNGTIGPDMSAARDMASNRDLAGSFICDPVKQDCGTGMKCTYTVDPNNMMSLAQTCVPVTGNVGFEMPCMRDMAGDPGMDNCAAGFFCSVIGWGGTTMNPDRHCNKTCNTTADCPANHHCIGRSTGAGDCIRDCGMLGSTSCGGGLVCATPEQDISSTMQNTIIFLTCRQAGPGGPADACTEDAQCMDGLLCDTQTDNTCSIHLCDDTHACPNIPDAGLSCMPFAAGNSLGVCQ
jgi:hypothetical protein